MRKVRGNNYVSLESIELRAVLCERRRQAYFELKIAKLNLPCKLLY